MTGQVSLISSSAGAEGWLGGDEPENLDVHVGVRGVWGERPRWMSRAINVGSSRWAMRRNVVIRPRRAASVAAPTRPRG